MKTFLVFGTLLLSTTMWSQSCCQVAFADLGESDKFKEAHEIPASIEYSAIGENITFPTSNGADGRAYLIKSPTPSTQYLVVIHEWWGLNDHIKKEADKFAASIPNVNVIAVDLYDGKVASERDKAAEYMQAAKEDRLYSILEGVRAYAGPKASLATVGWCFGGGWSLKASLHFGKQAAGCVMYYGMPVTDKSQLADLSADVLAIYAKKDGWITPQVAADFEKVMKGLNKPIESLSFDADHAFANPSSPRYEEKAAQAANKHALQFLKEHLK